MSNVLHKSCLVLNSAWQPIHERTVAEAFSMLCAGAACGMVIESPDNYYPVKTVEEWIQLKPRPQDEGIHTSRMVIREPRVIIASNFSKMPQKKRKFNTRGVAERDNFICQYSGQKLHPSEISIDHVVPRSRGGQHCWSNATTTSKKINSDKGNRLNHEVGLVLIKQPREPLPIPVSALLTPKCADHEIFLRPKM